MLQAQTLHKDPLRVAADPLASLDLLLVEVAIHMEPVAALTVEEQVQAESELHTRMVELAQ